MTTSPDLAVRLGDSGLMAVLCLRDGVVTSMTVRLVAGDSRGTSSRVAPGLDGLDSVMAALSAWPRSGPGDESGDWTRHRAFPATGTCFQRDVWRALCEIAPGETITYGELAERIGRPRAARAIGQAVGANPWAPLVPCHRVVAGDGSLGGYAGGTVIKVALLALEGIERKQN
ncbi:MAG: MGMT family protein [Halothiobacillaceae bacterium]|nr:MGMT family protein [Halothiobacillaceae bacterium]HER34591.1 MGMT family protein [Halothiobacillaceae bacterium]